MGEDKAALLLAGRPLVSWTVEALRAVTAEVWLVGGRREFASRLGLRFAPDLVAGAGPLGGIYSALMAAGSDVLVAACDMPLIRPALLRGLVSLAPGADAVVPVKDGESEPLLALYRRDCLPAIERALASGRKRAVSFFDAARVRFVGENEWRCWDLDGRSFTNVNTPGDLTVAAAVLHADGAGPGEG